MKKTRLSMTGRICLPALVMTFWILFMIDATDKAIAVGVISLVLMKWEQFE